MLYTKCTHTHTRARADVANDESLRELCFWVPFSGTRIVWIVVICGGALHKKVPATTRQIRCFLFVPTLLAQFYFIHPSMYCSALEHLVLCNQYNRNTREYGRGFDLYFGGSAFERGRHLGRSVALPVRLLGTWALFERYSSNRHSL